MANIRYVCLSDLHLGEEDSLLTHLDANGSVDPNAASPVLRLLAECLADLISRNSPQSGKPALILNGDILELALCASDVAIKVFAQFVAEIMPAAGSLFGEVVYIPGNHDHHLWEVARERQYLNYMRRIARIEALEPAWHTTKVFMDMAGKDRLANPSLTEIARRFPHLRDSNQEILTAYPNFGVLGEGAGRCIIFHHGHLIEAAYHLMSTAASLVFSNHKIPQDVDSLEGENFAWIDFFWSTMGRAGQVGADIERIYEATSSEKALGRITDALARNLAHRYNFLTPLPAWLEEQAFRALFRKAVVKRVAGQQERQMVGAGGEALSPEAEKSLGWYLDGPLGGQIQRERGCAPPPMTFIFGHTHKPFVRAPSGGLRWLNSGGWVIDTAKPRPEQGGAAILIDEELNAVSVQFYAEGSYEVRVEEPAPGPSALWRQVNAIVHSGTGPWRAFRETAEREAARRMANFARRVGAG